MPKTGALGMSIMGAVGMFATSLWQPVIGGMLDVERAMAQLEGMSYEAADLAAGQATLKFIALFPAVLIVAFGLLYFFKKPLLEAGEKIWQRD
jgi:predicted anti-sigma-YlaC factor YlaD